MHRRIIRTDTGYLIRESGTSRTIAVIPHDPLFESMESSERIAKQIKLLPRLIDHLRHESFHGNREASELLEELR